MNSRVSNLYVGNPNTADSTVDQRLAVSSSVVTFSALHNDTKYCVLDIQSNNVLVTFDGSDPVDATNGHLLVKEQGLITMSANAVKAMRLIRVTADAAVQLTEFTD